MCLQSVGSISHADANSVGHQNDSVLSTLLYKVSLLQPSLPSLPLYVCSAAVGAAGDEDTVSSTHPVAPLLMSDSHMHPKLYSPESVLRTVDNSGYHVSLRRYWHLNFASAKNS